jgi:F-type H+-transporting ATPase subunit b
MIFIIIILEMITGFGFNTNLLETNAVNVVVVARLVVKVVGDAFQELLDQRRQIVLLSLKDADIKAAAARQELEEAQKALEISRLQSEEIRKQASRTVEKENLLIAQKLEEDLRRIKENNSYRIQLERQQTVKSIAREVSQLALVRAEETLRITFLSQTESSRKQEELNDVHILYCISNVRPPYQIK